MKMIINNEPANVRAETRDSSTGRQYTIDSSTYKQMFLIEQDETDKDNRTKRNAPIDPFVSRGKRNDVIRAVVGDRRDVDVARHTEQVVERCRKLKRDCEL